MLVAEVIAPKPESNEKISCNGCDLEYSHKDYDVLLASKKLAYFDLIHAYYDIEVTGGDCICHNCLFKLLKCKLNASKTNPTLATSFAMC